MGLGLPKPQLLNRKDSSLINQKILKKIHELLLFFFMSLFHRDRTSRLKLNPHNSQFFTRFLFHLNGISSYFNKDF